MLASLLTGRLSSAPAVDSPRTQTQSSSRPVSPAASGRPAVDGKFLTVNGKRFWVKAVTYGTFANNDQGEPYPPFHQLEDDFARMADAGINTVRVYTPPSDRIADAAHRAGLMLMADVCWGPRWCELHKPEHLKDIHDWTHSHMKRLAGHPAMLLHCVGNEITPLLVRWYGRRHVERFLQGINDIVKSHDPLALTTYAGHPPTEFLHLPFLDVVSFNVYLEQEAPFRRYLARLQNLAGDRPLLISELGLDSYIGGTAGQAETLDWQLRAVFEHGLCGAAVYAWTDEWAIFEESIEGWAFGITDAQRKPRPALDAVSRIYKSDLYHLRDTPWPRVSVVVCSHNGGNTLGQCLRSLSSLNYPNYETIVVDDGSTDQTPEILHRHRHDAICISVEKGGLSRARNLGIERATGEIVAFIDSDAYADPDWLYHIVTAMERCDAVAAGGPNLSPPTDPFTSQCVDHAPGNPTHVLIDDQLAEHVPGCNMAFRKAALEKIGNFNAVHRAAGDDVDVCWKLLARGRRIAFAPGGFVWHHRRPTVGRFLRQQRGYGYAESHLRVQYPGRFNTFGHLVWTGGIYDGVHRSLRQEGDPRAPFSLLRPRIYFGCFGSAQFQSIYQRLAPWWFQIFMNVEWQVAALCFLLAGVTALLASQPAAASTCLAIGAAMLSLTFGLAFNAGYHAARTHRWKGRDRLRGQATVAFLHLAQPFARLRGRMAGWWATRKQPRHFKTEQCIWGNISDRETWLTRLADHLTRAGWKVQKGIEWDEHDLVVEGPGPCRVKLQSVAEERLEKGWHIVRFRVSSRSKFVRYVLLGVGAAALVLEISMPVLLPLALPTVLAIMVFATAGRNMRTAVMQLAIECAEGMDLPRAEAPYV